MEEVKINKVLFFILKRRNITISVYKKRVYVFLWSKIKFSLFVLFFAKFFYGSDGGRIRKLKEKIHSNKISTVFFKDARLWWGNGCNVSFGLDSFLLNIFLKGIRQCLLIFFIVLMHWSNSLKVKIVSHL